MAAIRQAVVTWNGDLASGQGVGSASSSKAFTSLPVSWAARTQSAEGRTSPEERQRIAKLLRERVYGKEPPDVREAERSR